MPFKHLALASLMLLPVSALADWQLIGNESSINFVSVKKSQIAETHHFKGLSGKIADDGKASVKIDLASVETNIPIRNERMQQMLFDTAKYASASINTQVDVDKLMALKPGQTMTIDSKVTVDLHGQQQTEPATLQVTGLQGDRILVTTSSAILLNAGNYQLLEGVERLRKIAGLDSISPIIPVTAKLVYAKN